MESELISKLLVDKLIGISIKEHYAIKAEHQVGFHCAEYATNTYTNPFLEQRFMYFDLDDLDENQVQYHSEQVFYNIYKDTMNTWVELKEPSAPSVDRDTSTLIEFTAFQQPQEEDDEEAQPLKEEDKNENNNNQEENNNDVVNDNNELLSGTAPELIKKDKKPKKVMMIDLPSYPIELGEEDLKRKEETPEIIALREEYEAEKLRIIEEKRRLEIEQEKERQILQEKKQNKKGFNFNKVRFDINGELIAFKPIKLRDLSKDFYCTRSNIKNLGKIKGANEKKPTKLEIEVEHNPHLGDVAYPTTMTVPGQPRKDSKDKTKKENIIVQPAGSNFDIFLPEVGVRLIEGAQKKGGSKEFGKRFNKTSSLDYDKMLNEYIPLINRAKLKTQADKNMYSSVLTEPNRSNMHLHSGTENIESFDSKNLTNIHNTSGLNLANQNSTSLLNISASNNNPLLDNPTNTNANVMFPSINQSAINSRLYRTSEMDFDSIKLNRSNLSSLKYTLEEIVDLDEGRYVLPSSTIGRGQSKSFRLGDSEIKVNLEEKKRGGIDTVNKFNKEVMENKEWGVIDYPTNKSVSFTKPRKGNLYKELGKSIVMTKLPRSRKFNISKFKL